MKRIVTGLCRLAGLTRQGYYRARRTREYAQMDEARLIAWVHQERSAQPRLGGRKLHHVLKPAQQNEQIKVGRDRFFDLLRRHDLLVKRKPKKARTTYRDPALPVYRNLLSDLTPTQPHQVWVSDITYLATEEDFVYLSLVTDRVSRQIVGWNLASSLDAKESVKALRRAIAQLPQGRWPIHHSDRGSQYCCHEYVEVLQARGLSISMTEENHCYENSCAERVNGILKSEYNLDAKFRTKAQALRATKQAIELYNHRRPHTSLRMQTPAQVHAAK